jgi:two-component system response regulator ChvI
MKTVLLVEDDREKTLSIGIRLKAMGYKLVRAADAISAISQARKTNPDVAVIDINLPGGDGFMVAEKLNEMIDTAMMPFIFMTESMVAGLEQRANELCAVAFFEKPFDAKFLVDAIEMSTFELDRPSEYQAENDQIYMTRKIQRFQTLARWSPS